MLHDLFVSGNRNDVELESQRLAGIRHKRRQLRIAPKRHDVLQRRLDFRAFVTLAHGKNGFSLPREPQNTCLRGPGEIVNADVVKNDERIALHMTAHACPSGFEFGSRNVVE